MKLKVILISAVLGFGIMPVSAQMSEDKIVAYIAEQQEKGMPQEQIVKNLANRGVSIQQLQQIREKYERRNSTGMVGNTVSPGKDRSRVPYSRRDDSRYAGAFNLIQSDEDARYQRTVTGDDRYQMMYDESDFLFPDTLALLMESLSKQKKEIFGHSLFKADNMTFEPNPNIATPRNYMLGPGDEVVVDIWGASQTSLREVISPDGNIVIENIGPVYLNGMTVQEADRHLKKVLSQIYSGLGNEDNENHIQLSLGQNRSIQVNVMGEVENPGTYQISSFATVFNALYMAGGVNDIGSLRAIGVYRSNNRVVSVDLYDYLMNGVIEKDIRLEDNDVIVVSPMSGLVCIDGRIRRPMYYEMKPNESLAKLLDYAGGFVSDAYRKDVSVTRMGNLQRSMFTVAAKDFDTFLMMDGDSVAVDSILITYSNMVEVRGAVMRPGKFQVGESIRTLDDAIKAAGGFREDASLTRVLLNRTNPDKTLANQAVDLSGYAEGNFDNVEIRNNDVLYIPSLFDLRQEPTMGIYGEVRFPGVYKYADNTQIEDLIIQAGGMTDAASVAKVDVVRRSRDKSSLNPKETISRTFSFTISEDLSISDETFVLEPFDEVYVRKSPGYAENRRVLVEGEVLFPGYYSLSSKNERLSDIVSRAGLFTEEAYPAGARLERTMTDEERLRLKDMTRMLAKNDSTSVDAIDMATTFNVGIDLQAAIDNPGSQEDIYIRDGDRLFVPEFSNTVKMNGQVMYSNTIPYEKGKNLMYYIGKAGGYSEDARKSKSYVVYANGTVAKARKHSGKIIQPGCEIVVPAKSERERMSTTEILSLSSTSASLATVVIALINLFK
ncbi:MAG: SLBB domain-containing protein [Bacteroidaceae bacterium]|nr:SLBB domain-containing protein [Bacteroidaceae bacterium]